MSQLLQVNEYRYVRTGGVTELTQVSDRTVVPTNVVKVNWESDTNGSDTRFTVHMLDGKKFITDWGGVSDIQNWSAPFQNNN